MIHYLDGKWIPESPSECYNATKLHEGTHCEGCIMKERSSRKILFLKLENRDIESVEREKCTWFNKMTEANSLHIKVTELTTKLVCLQKMHYETCKEMLEDLTAKENPRHKQTDTHKSS